MRVCWQGGLIVKRHDGQVVNLEPVGEIPHALSISIIMRDDNHLVSAFDQTKGEMIQMCFNATHVREEEVGYHANTMLNPAF